ncbi:MAG TPA: isocitrate/isopropylmalate dehydrogenase family protein [Gammaproteobacteria bacterium]|nr:isocitrate/isopropylmalate dehydrogenase family protein [Gammaproteobacteria bacterium]
MLPGDGIGPEITAATLKVVNTLNEKLGLELDLVERPVGLSSLRTEGSSLTKKTLEDARKADGVILGPVSTYEYPPVDRGGINPSATIRVAFDLYANIRPAKTYPGVPSKVKSMDLVVVRENTEGFYADRNMAVGSGEFQPTEDVALSVRKITRKGSVRIARAAFDLARRRRKKVTVVHKANVLRVSDGLFLNCVKEVAADYPDVSMDESIIDAMTARLIRTPDAFDVVCTTNMFGDILSDEAAELAGGLGLAGALNAGDTHAIAQATHGSAPDIQGKGIGNPVALILSAGMLLDWLGARHGRQDLQRAWQALQVAVEKALSNPANRTPDMGGRGTSDDVANAVISALDV